MIECSLNTPEDLSPGHQRVKCSTHCKFDNNLTGTMEGRFKQRLRIGEITAKITSLDTLGCEVSINIQVRNGRFDVDGTVRAYGPEELRIADGALSDLPLVVECFAREHPNSSFSLNYTQKPKKQLAVAL